ncbi:MAG TPA: CBS domain-containing protein [Solirubrobacteraceae bacterium]|nr:CBS domain-containing protein [Solirubrobacteraceae bacterium]
MARFIRDVMTKDPTTVEASATAHDAADVMRREDVGAVLVTSGGTLQGILTDRDIVVRAVADGRDPDEVAVSDICTPQPETLSPDDPVEEAIRDMRSKGIRRLPVVDGDRPVGILSIGDLAVERDTDSALAEISAQDPNN